MSYLVRVEEPTELPIELEDLKQHLRILHDRDDEYVTSLAHAAVSLVEKDCNIGIMPQTWELRVDSPFDLPIALPRGPVQSIESVAYIDEDGQEQVLATSAYRIAESQPARVYGTVDVDWPTVRAEQDALRIRFVVHYPSDGASPPTYAVPASIKHAIRLLVTQWYQTRSSVTVGSTTNELPFSLRTLLSYERMYV